MGRACSAAGTSRAVLAHFAFPLPLSTRLAFFPKFKVFQSVIFAITIQVMYIFKIKKSAAQPTRHNQTVFKHRVAFSTTTQMVFRRFQEYDGVRAKRATSPYFRQRVCNAPAVSSVRRFVTMISQKTNNFCGISAKPLSDAMARLSTIHPPHNLINIGYEWRSFLTTYVPNTYTIFCKNAAHCLIVVAERLADFNNSTTCSVSIYEHGGSFRRDDSRCWHVPFGSNIYLKGQH